MRLNAWRIASKVIVLVVLFGPLMAAFGSAGAQSVEAPQPSREQLELQISIMQDHVKKLEAQLAAGRQAPSELSDPSLVKAYIDARKKDYDYLVNLRDMNIRAFKAQQAASYVLLALVILVVVAGTLFAGLQLWRSLTVGVQATTELEFSASKVRITSSVVGIVVLTLSIAFLYIYTKEVYHIRVVGEAPAETAAKAP
jgi:hypothetical protein